MKDRCVKCEKVLTVDNTFGGNWYVCKTCSNKRSIDLFKIGAKYIGDNGGKLFFRKRISDKHT